MKRFVLIFARIVFIGLFLVGCASMESSYRRTQSLDTVAAYEDFIKSYPDSPFTKEAKRRFQELKGKKAFEEAETRNTKTAYEEFIYRYPNSEFTEEARERVTESDEKALIRTIRIGTIQAFQGFMESYPNSKYLSIVKARIEFLNAVATDEYRKFITQYPNNPFVVEAKASFPILWLKEKGEVGVVINVGEIVRWKGIFRGRRVTEKEVRQKVFKKLKKDLERESIQGILLDGSNDPKAKDVQTILVIEYKEKDVELESPYGGAVGNLRNTLFILLRGYPVKISSPITIKDVNTGFEYYSNVPDINYKVDRDKMVKALEPFREEAIPSLVIALYDKNKGVRKKAAAALEKIRQDLGEDPTKRHKWWEQNKNKFLKNR